MASYWVYLNNNVTGPYPIEQLIRLRGFSRHTQVCIDDSSGRPGSWINAAQIPELAHIFKAVDERETIPPPPSAPRPTPKPAAPRPSPRPAPAPAPVPVPKSMPVWPWLLAALLLAGGGGAYWHRQKLLRDNVAGADTAKSLILNAALPSTSAYPTIDEYLQDKGLTPKWDVKTTSEGMFQINASWKTPRDDRDGAVMRIHAFSVNVPAQSVRAANSAAEKLLAEGFKRPAEPKAAPKPKSRMEKFTDAVGSRREAVQRGDFSAVWDLFSRRKRAEMAKGGISREGFIRLQSLTHKLESAPEQELLKTSPETDGERLALLKQTQAKREDVFIKQRWIYEDDTWRLDDEEKRSGTPAAPPPPAPSSRETSEPAPAATPPSGETRPRPSKEAILALPGLSQ
jgi:hypothetical protein